MTIAGRDLQILLHIVNYTLQIEKTIERFGMDENQFLSDCIYRNAVSMPIMQIGELAKRLSPEFRKECSAVAWNQIIGMRNFFAHEYADMNLSKIWIAATEDIPRLKNTCENILGENGVPIPEQS